MESNKEFNEWLKIKKREQKEIRNMVLISLVLTLFLFIFYVFADEMGLFLSGSVAGFWFLYNVFEYFKKIYKKPSKDDFLREKKQKQKVKAEEKKVKAEEKKKIELIKTAEREEKEKKEKEEADRLKDIESKFEGIEKNFKLMMSIESPRPKEFKDNLIKYEKEISSKGSIEYLHKLVKISTFLDDLWKHLLDTRQSIRDMMDIKSLAISYKEKKESEKNKSIDDIVIDLERKSKGDFKDYSADGLMQHLNELSQSGPTIFTNEFANVSYLQAMSNAMLIFLLDGNNIYFFEILEVFDKLGALDSSWQKSVSKKMDSIETKLDLMMSGISNLNDSIDTLIEKNDDISKQLGSIESGIAINNVLQAITTYQTIKINKNIKSLKS